jgi:protein-glutamine gamma-glutamyltransferase
MDEAARRTIAVSVFPALVIAAVWQALERPHDELWRSAAIVALALAPALVRRTRLRILAVAVALVLATRVAFGLSILQVRHGFFGPLGARFSNGFLDFYDVRAPFDPRVHTEMRGVVLAAVFGFVLALGLAVAARRPVAATLVLVLGAGWPATLAGDAGALGRGVAILVGVLVILGGLTARRVPRVALPAAAVLVLVAFAASSSPAVAKQELVRWQRWDFYNAPHAPVSVSYVWDAQYGGIIWAPERTTVLEVKAPPMSLFWRAAVLDDFAADRWLQASPRAADSLEPAASRVRSNLVRQEVTVEALADTRLVGGSVPVSYSAGGAPLVRPEPGFAYLPSGLTRGFQYSVWSYAPRPTPARLSASPPVYPAALTAPGGFLDVWPGVTAPPFGVSGRPARVNALLDAHPGIARYIPLEADALAVAGKARTPYAAAVDLESWFRSRGAFRYTDHPSVFEPAPLVGFVAQTRAGYCQYFAGAMALMLRYLGVPARVAVGFSSGTYDAKKGVWTVTDHDAHAWVEVWFRGYGWLPFDPTPSVGRPELGELSAPYSSASRGFDLRRAGVTPAGTGATIVAQAAHRHDETGPGPSVAASSSGGSAAASTSHHTGLLTLLLLVLAAVVGVIVVTKLAVRRARYLTRDPRRVAAACRRELADFLLDQRIEAARSATLHELGALVRRELAVDPDPFVAAATAARFGRPEGAGRAARDARRELRSLVRRVRSRLGARDRVRGLLSLRSLGFAPYRAT